ncbi:transglutaminaseTgpA domain-containing protein [Pseudoclavibacter helvolus]|uniref:transglutaminase family protein n=1 Tax=Pseudoclavibacter helvolus TaxID=255205 RepID=UPI003C75C11D
MSAHTTATTTATTTAQMRRRQGWKGTPGANGSWVVTVALAVLIFSATNLLWPIFDTNGWSARAIVLVAIMLGAAALVRTFTGSQLWALVASILGGTVVLIGFTAQGSPRATVEGWGVLAEQLVDQLRSDAAPLRETDAMTMLVLIGVAIIVVLCDFFVFGIRGRSLALLPLLAFPLIPMALGIDAFDGWAYVLAALALAVFLYAVSSWHQRVHDEELSYQGFLVDSRGFAGLGGALAVTAVSLVAVLVASTVVPPPPGIDVIRQASTSGLSTNRANPIIDLGEDLRRNNPVEVLRYATTTDQGALPYLSLQTLSDLSGDDDWMPGDFDGNVSVDGGDLPLPAGVSAGAQASEFTTRIVLNDGVSSFLPRPGFAANIVDLQGEFLLDEQTGDVRSANDEALAQNYEIQTVVPTPSFEVISQIDFDVPPQLEPLTQVPEGPSADRIRSVLEGIIDETAPLGTQALQLQSYFAQGFAYSETAPVQQGYDGTSLDVIAEFLDARAGYCVHYASSMAVMARMLGIPSRIGVGFTPGSAGELNAEGQPVYTVTSDQLHAWAELYLPGHGWVMFETTPAGALGNLVAPGPGETTAPTFDQAETASPSPSPVETESTAAPTGPTETETPTPTASDGAESAGEQEGGDAGVDPTAVFVALAIVGGLIALAALVLLPAFLRGARRRARRTAVLTGTPPQHPSPGSAAWQEVTASAVDYGVPLPAGLTPEAVVASITRALERSRDEPGASAPSDAARAALDRLRVEHEHAAFAEPGSAEALTSDARVALWDDVLVVRSALRSSAQPAARRRAVLAPASLTGRR